MLEIKFIEKNIDLVKEKISNRGFEIDFGEFERFDKIRKGIIKEVENLEHQRNQQSKKVGELKRSGDEKEVKKLLNDLKVLSDKIKELNTERSKVEDEFREFLLLIPNIPHESVPVGIDDSANIEIRKSGQPPEFDFQILDHVEIGKKLGILDLERASKITGSRFSLYIGHGAKLERALINFMLDIHTNEHNYIEILPPFVANTDSFIGTGNLPKFEEDLFKLNDTNYYLVPTAEVPVTNIHRDEILELDELPKNFVAYTPCFRKEAGSYGKDVHGIMRQHQFNKVELVKLTHPNRSYEELESLTNDAERILELLNLPYRVVVLSTGDLGFSSAKTYDLEVWIPSENRYREISSCSNFESFQARRSNIRFRGSSGAKPEFVHTLNGSGLAIGRTVIAIMENFQLPDGSVKVPEVLVPYMGDVEIIS